MPDDDLALVLGHPVGDPVDDPAGHLAAASVVPSRGRRRREHEHRRRVRRRRGRVFVVLLVALVVVGGGGLAAATVLRPLVSSLTASGDYSGDGTGSVTVTIAQGATGRAIGALLQSKGVVKTAGAFVDAASANPASQSIQPGQYRLRQKMSGASAVTLLLDPTARSVDKVTIREGLRATEVLAALANATGKPLAQYQAAVGNPAAIGLPASAKGKVEGWLFPDTYSFQPDATPAQQLGQMIAQTRSVLASLGVADADAETVLVTASIAEVEAASPADYAKVARVLDNRLADMLHNGRRLQLDSTVSYAVGKRTLTTTDAERAVDSPYNTYKYGGLPIGPISNPGKAAIAGVLNPTPGPWLFFVTVDPSTGATQFAVTPAQHEVYVKQFQAWCAAHPGRC